LTIEIEDLTFETIIGVLPYERVNKQRVIVNLRSQYDYVSKEYIDYVGLVDIIKNSMIKQKFKLIEEAIEYISKEIESRYPKIKNLYIKISKPDILANCNVAISKTFNYQVSNSSTTS